MNISATLYVKLDPTQFTALAHMGDVLVNVLASLTAGDDPAKIVALTEKLKASSDALAAVVKQQHSKE
jgi:hypothetical protein